MTTPSEKAERATAELINRVEACLRGLEYVSTEPNGSFWAFNHSFDCSGLTHIEGVRHERHVSSENLLSALYRAWAHSFSGRTHYPLQAQ